MLKETKATGPTPAEIRIPEVGERTHAIVGADWPNAWPHGENLLVHVKTATQLAHGVRLHYRHTDQTEGPFRTLAMEYSDGGYQAVIPGSYLVPEWDLLVRVSAVDTGGHGLAFPGLYHEQYPFPYHVITVL
jgi:hypothetical protein